MFDQIEDSKLRAHCYFHRFASTTIQSIQSSHILHTSRLQIRFYDVKILFRGFCRSKSYKRDSWRDIEVYWKLESGKYVFMVFPRSYFIFLSTRYVFVICEFIFHQIWKPFISRCSIKDWSKKWEIEFFILLFVNVDCRWSDCEEFYSFEIFKFYWISWKLKRKEIHKLHNALNQTDKLPVESYWGRAFIKLNTMETILLSIHVIHNEDDKSLVESRYVGCVKTVGIKTLKHLASYNQAGLSTT